jgi:hypothetical protein
MKTTSSVEPSDLASRRSELAVGRPALTLLAILHCITDQIVPCVCLAHMEDSARAAEGASIIPPKVLPLSIHQQTGLLVHGTSRWSGRVGMSPCRPGASETTTASIT